jgi:subtilase family serine protease
MPNQAYVYLSRDTTISPADTYLGQIPFSIVLSGRSSSRTGYMMVPYGTAPGVCYLGVVADGSNSVSEINEHNNTNYAMVQVKG